MIGTPYKPDEADNELTSAYALLPSDQQNGSYWSDPKTDDFKSKAKTFYIAEQKCRCCYCDKEIMSENKRLWDLDHILCRDQRPLYMFEPENLAISCVPCNIAKSAKDVATGKLYKKFPRRSSSYKIIHPHFDNYYEHIRIFSGLIYVPVGGSKKGKATIEVCNLSRFADIFEGKLGPVCDKRYEGDVAQLLFATERHDAVAAARKLLTAFDEGPLE